MLRYIAATCASDDPRQIQTMVQIRKTIASRREWLVHIDTPHLFVATERPRSPSENCIVLPGRRGAVIGSLFVRPSQPGLGAPALTTVEQPAAELILSSHGKSLVDAFWGSYVYFVRDPQLGTTYVGRGPMSALACCYVSTQGVHVFFSTPDDCIALGLLSFSFNWNYIRAQAVGSLSVCRETAINEITSIECGECLEVGADSCSLKIYWSPSAVARRGVVSNFAEAVSCVRQVTRDCVASWAADHEKVLLLLSGGLDSSIVHRCLQAAPTRPHITSFNSYSPGADADERKYARSLVQYPNLDYIERERRADIDLSMFLDCALTVRPVLNFSACDQEPATAQIARDRGITAIFNGELGDNVFGSVSGHETVTEHVWRHGIGASLLRVAVDYARLENRSVWEVLRDGIRDGRAASRQSDFAIQQSLRSWKKHFQPDALLVSLETFKRSETTRAQFTHPWLKDAEGVGPCAFQMTIALTLVTSAAYHSPFGTPDSPTIIAPLASQPLVELSLGLAGHLHIRNGRDRAVARHAFAPDLPSLVLNRRSKGGPDLWVRDLIARNQRFLRETLLDGILAREQILDRRKMEILLSGDIRKATARVTLAIVYLYIEAWLRRWTTLSSPTVQRYRFAST